MDLEPLIYYFNRVLTYDPLVVIVELFLVGLVVSWVVNFLEGTRGERLFRGVFFVLITGSLVLNLVVDRFGLERIQFMYKGFLIAMLIVAVAAFQPEIRRALISIGQAKLLSPNRRHMSLCIEEIISAVKDMSKSRTGAIIVIERQVGLAEFVETGERIDARITAGLLKTIFYEGTPLHDMAVVIHGERIIAASVQLPLAESGSIDVLQLGSRHRAAIGITTGSDAMVVVVSEETGIVSIAEDGNLIRNVKESALRKRLSNAISGDESSDWFWSRKKNGKDKNKKEA
ncbi:DNA integrity scanning protein DisA [Limihaloglobus sulfuriphilus]|uniref:Diadenylate cyclase n=1 Tax=Limihaloglobus sulfuriphilus TaxID=1851148 RepID=A0A1Q2MIX7_9BACT|nr:diadenylate cyclase CdaA [Limihaloglobus sulfuriphilus]AQQ72317.1 DNA integrity scanning protein DisA [Limihaloglobus sulfuriphilus]